MNIPNSFAQFQYIQYFPPEIQYLIVEALDNQRDIVNLLIAFRRQLPGGYWCAHFPKEIVFESKDLVNRDMDWPYLYLGVL